MREPDIDLYALRVQVVESGSLVTLQRAEALALIAKAEDGVEWLKRTGESLQVSQRLREENERLKAEVHKADALTVHYADQIKAIHDLLDEFKHEVDAFAPPDNVLKLNLDVPVEFWVRMRSIYDRLPGQS